MRMGTLTSETARLLGGKGRVRFKFASWRSKMGSKVIIKIQSLTPRA